MIELLRVTEIHLMLTFRFHFKAYSTEGKYLGESEFKIEGYDLVNIPGSFTFIDGFVYVLGLKMDDGKSLRILKCRLEYR